MKKQIFNSQKRLFINNWYKLCLKTFTNNNDSSFLDNLLGIKQHLYTFVDPFYFRRLLIKILKAIKALKKLQTKIIFITNFSNYLLEKKFKSICYKNKIIQLNFFEFIPGFLTNKNKLEDNLFIFTLFLEIENRSFIISECQRVNIPIVEFSDLFLKKFSSTFLLPGEFKNFFAQNLIISLISLCFQQSKKKNVYNFKKNKELRLQKNKYFFKQIKTKSNSKKIKK
jgi:hypothetical protein